MKRYINIIFLVLLITLISCDIEFLKPKVKFQDVNGNPINLNVGESITITTNLSSENKNNINFSWSSENENVATVNDKGVVTAKAKGTTKIFVTSNDASFISQYFVVNVNSVLTKLNIKKVQILLESDSVTLITNVFPKDVSDTTVTWTSSDNEIATVNEKGVVKAKKQGNVNIIATSKMKPDLSEVCVFIITKQIPVLNIRKDLKLIEKETYTLGTNITPKDLKDTSVTWTSDNESVATVDKNGVVTAISKGTTNIKAALNINPFIFEICNLTVESTREYISLDHKTLEILVDKKKKINATILPAGTVNKNIIWKTSNPYVASVVNGEITGIIPGTALIIATNSNSKVSDTCIIRVTLDLFSFKFEVAKNPKLSKDLVLTNYNENNFGGDLIYIADNTLIPTFTATKGVKVIVNGIDLNGETPVDFTSAVNFLVSSLDGTVTKNYRVALNVLNDTMEIDDNGVLVCRKRDKSNVRTAILADSMNGKRVLYIGEEAFNEPAKYHSFLNYLQKYNLISLKLPNSLLEIGKAAFNACSGLNQELILPPNLKKIGRSAFVYSHNFFGSIIIPNSVTYIDSAAFLSCGFNGTLTIPNSISKLIYGVFGFNKLTGSLIIPDNITSIEDYVFWGSKFSGNLIIPNSIKYIGINCFRDCDKFTGSLQIPTSDTLIGLYAFKGCTGFDGNLILPNSVKYIHESAFDSCINFKGELYIPSSVIRIDDYAFKKCSGFSKILYSDKTILGKDVFLGTSVKPTTY